MAKRRNAASWKRTWRHGQVPSCDTVQAVRLIMPAVSPALKARIVSERILPVAQCRRGHTVRRSTPVCGPGHRSFRRAWKVLSSLSGVTEILYALFGPVDQRHISRDAGALSHPECLYRAVPKQAASQEDPRKPRRPWPSRRSLTRSLSGAASTPPTAPKSANYSLLR